jgi:hypothetical protein
VIALNAGVAMLNTAIASSGRAMPFVVAAAVFAVLLGITVGLWTYYGPTVFYEMLAAGLAYCF